jgi:hypothetical protein
MSKLAAAMEHAMPYRFASLRMLVVMGMHRSGTSCVTRVLNLMGASLGPVNEHSGQGSDEIHWESGIVNWINEDLLVRAGGSWQAPPQKLRVVPRDYWRCRRVLWQFAGAPTAVLKDPRMMLTYPVWRAVLPEHRLVVCLRYPLDVARSLARRDGMALEQGLALWATYNRRLLEELDTARPVAWVDFDEGAAGVRRLVHEMAGVWGLQATAEALSYYDQDVHHHRGLGELPEDVTRLYAEMKRRAASARRAGTP